MSWRASGKLYGLTYTYTGYPMVRAGAPDRGGAATLAQVRKGRRRIFAKAGCPTPLERDGDNKQASWRA